MSITFNRTHLISVTNQALREHERAQRNYKLACENYRAQHAKDNTERTRRNARQLRDMLTRALKKQGPVSAHDIRAVLGQNSYHIAEGFYVPPADHQVERAVTAPKGFLKPSEVVEARALLKVLQAATGETISVNELKLLGLKNLTPIFEAAAAKVA